jgi:hypothetical protein
MNYFDHRPLADAQENIIKFSATYDVSAKSAATSHACLAWEAPSCRPAGPCVPSLPCLSFASPSPCLLLHTCTAPAGCSLLHAPDSPPLLPIGATGVECIGDTCAKDSPPISATGAAHLLLRLDRKWMTTPLDCESDSPAWIASAGLFAGFAE